MQNDQILFYSVTMLWKAMWSRPWKVTVLSALAHVPREAEKTCANANRALTCHLKRHIYVIWMQSCEVCVVPLFISSLLSVLGGSRKFNAVEKKIEIHDFFIYVHSAFLFHLCSQSQRFWFHTFSLSGSLKLCLCSCRLIQRNASSG